MVELLNFRLTKEKQNKFKNLIKKKIKLTILTYFQEEIPAFGKNICKFGQDYGGVKRELFF